MWKSAKALIIGLGLLFMLPCGPASAQTTKTPINNTGWTSVGTGPLFLSTIGHAWYAVSGTTPSLVEEGFSVPPEGVAVNTTLQVWARLREDYKGTAYTYPTVAGTFSGTFTWPGTAGNGVLGSAAAGGATGPYINTYIAGGIGSSVGNPLFTSSAATLTWPGTAGNGVVGAAAAGGTTAPYTNTYNVGGIGSSAGSPLFTNSILTWPGTAGNAAAGADPGAGTMPYTNAINQNAPVKTLIVGTITAVDTIVTTQVLGSFQTQYKGVPTAGSTVTTPVTAAGDIEVEASIDGGTANVTLHMEIAQNNAWYGRGLFLDGNTAPIWINGINGGLRFPEVMFTGVTSGSGIDFYRVRATTFTVLTGTPVVTVTIKQSNRNSGIYAFNLPTSAANVAAVAAVNTQFGGPGFTPFDTNATKIAGVTLGAPVAWGSTPSGVVQSANVNCITGCSASTITNFSPTVPASTLGTPLTPAASSVASIAAPTGGGSVLIKNVGTALGYIRTSLGSGTATANDIPFLPGDGCVLTMGTATFLNAYSPSTAGSAFNAIAGTGLGNCPTGGGTGGSGGGGSLTWPGTAGNGVVGAPATGGTTAPYVMAYLPDIASKTLTVANPAVGALGAPGVASAVQMGANSPGNMSALIQANASVPIAITSAVTTQLVGLTAGQTIYITGYTVTTPGTGNFTLEYGTGTLCATGTTVLTGTYEFGPSASGPGVNVGGALGSLHTLPAGNALCAVTTTAAHMNGSLSYAKF